MIIEKGKTCTVNQPHVSQAFSLHKTSEALRISLSFSEKTWAFLLLWDSNHQLRWQYVYTQEEKSKEVIIAVDPAFSSFSAVSGAIPKGEWKLEMFCPTYSSAPVLSFTLERLSLQALNRNDKKNWAIGSEGGFRLEEYQPNTWLKKGKRWYKGDFHTHTNESDGKMTPFRNMEQAKKMGLDFFVATDHNVIPTMRIKDPDLLVIPGVEITSSKGHFNALGIQQWVDWRPSCEDGGMESEAGMNRLLQDVQQAGGLRSINHPMLNPWHWTFEETALSEVDTIEIWNDPTFSDNVQATEQALILWNTLCNDGYRLTGIGGSDSHLLPEESYEEGGPPSLIGDPCTYVYAEDLSANSILTSVAEGKVYVSRGPVIDMEMLADGEEVHLGSTVKADRVEFSLTVSNSPGSVIIEWIINGEIVQTTKLIENQRIMETFDLTGSDFAWIRFQMRQEDGKLLAFSNPIYKGTKTPSIHNWRNLLQKAGL
ncbi:CehA/McbA family metallohydrolase [Radiobacillus deserti]|uniref:Polymerase/histidinol phosphatase N-terminal domain-containing protein n=1 Tax=Radiobacillus deserti TaxID=2594883 RepID=A0A516KJ64_9BACI|nr:CehA/McbA family metallohydrolase [Radiobacillus deserti]QDP41437.1 hypothetical protein FN924_15360 [Radiobacillus deserti]